MSGSQCLPESCPCIWDWSQACSILSSFVLPWQRLSSRRPTRNPHFTCNRRYRYMHSLGQILPPCTTIIPLVITLKHLTASNWFNLLRVALFRSEPACKWHWNVQQVSDDHETIVFHCPIRLLWSQCLGALHVTGYINKREVATSNYSHLLDLTWLEEAVTSLQRMATITFRAWRFC
jgi:hypothetical protein